MKKNRNSIFLIASLIPKRLLQKQKEQKKLISLSKNDDDHLYKHVFGTDFISNMQLCDLKLSCLINRAVRRKIVM
jgi:hypothetical protein